MFFSLRLKTIIGIAAIEAVLLAMLILTALTYMGGTIEEGLTQRAHTAASLFAITTKDAVLSYDLASLEAFTREAMNNPGMVYARVRGEQDIVFADSGDATGLARTFAADTLLEQVDDGIFDTFAEIREGDRVYGRVEIGLDTASIDQAIGHTKQLVATIAAIEMVLVALFSFFLGGYLTRQLRSLRQAAREIADGSLDVVVPVQGRDEISEVATAFNKMIANLQSASRNRDRYEDELEQLNHTLEDRVRRRTQSLEEKNKELTAAYEKLQSAQSQLLQSEKMASVGQLAAGVAHEINNPVGFISSNLESLHEYVDIYQTLLQQNDDYRNSSDDERRQEIARAIERKQDEEDIAFVHEDILSLLRDSIEGAGRVREIVQGLQNFSRADSARRKPTDINECIASTLKVAHNKLKYTCEIETDLHPLPCIECNAGQVNQVLLNLVVNAAQAIESRGRIRIETRDTSDFVLIRIADNGKGIPETDLDKLFDPFFTTKPVGEGTGLGLAIVYGIIQEHNGTIDVDSEVGVGTIFTIELPRVVADTGSLPRAANQD